jgi:hypothetical protein
VNGLATRAYIAAPLRRQGRLLLNQQCWLWGQDVRRTSENLLISFGFERTRPPEGVTGSSQYTLAIRDETILRLWGFGLFYGASEGIYINRYEFIPRIARISADGWQAAEEMRALAAAPDTTLLEEVLWKIAMYERWVLQNYGIAYREACLSGWSKRCIPCQALPVAWEALARELALSSMQNSIE